ncbi:MAG TPA: hypothetical protein VNP98_10175 [Chthoniobacterales bacterium]|nr:hypothetical protein [Chthoniobacterales bacterium]
MEPILDRAQKLFGRGFLIAAFVPSLLFVFCSGVLFWGFAALSSHAHQLAKAEWKENIFELGLWLIIVYLFAYVIYGARAFLHQLYQGAWRVTLSFKKLEWLEWILNRPYRAGVWLGTHRMRRYREIAEERVAALNWPRWVTECHFGDAFSDKKLNAREAKAEIDTLQSDHLAVVWSLEKKKDICDKDYWDLLARAQVLRANSKRFDKEIQQQLDELIAMIRRTFEDPNYHKQLDQAVTRYREMAKREWSTAYGGFSANFPEDERWMRATQLGILNAVGDLYPYRRYGITLSNLWPRLIHVVPEEARLRLEDANIYLDFTVIMSSVFALLTVVSLALATFQPNAHLFYPRNFLIPLTCVAVSFVFYRLAIVATRSLGSQVQAAVDLFRLKLLDMLDVKRPGTFTQEKEIWTEIHFFIEQADLRMTHVQFKEPSTPSTEGWFQLWKALTGNDISSDAAGKQAPK